MDEQARGLHPRRHVGELVAHPLQRGKRLAECLAFRGVVDRGIKRGLGHADGAGPDTGAEQIEGAHRDPESVINLAEDVIRRDAHVIEAEPADRVVGHERDRLAAEAAALSRHRERGDTACARTRGGSCEDRVDVGVRGIGDEDLLPAQAVSVAVALGGERDARPRRIPRRAR